MQNFVKKNYILASIQEINQLEIDESIPTKKILSEG